MTAVDSRFRLLAGKGNGVSRYLIYYLGHWQLYDPTTAKILTFTQGLAGDFAQARPNGVSIQGTGPGLDRPLSNVGVKLLTDPAWADRDTFSTGAGQSTRGAATPTATLDDDTTAVTGQPYLTIQPPLPGKLVTFKNGPNPNPDGPSSPAVDTVLQPDDYESDELYDACAGLNPTILRELPGLTAGIVWANALPDTARHTLCDGFVGSTDLNDVTGYFNNVVSATYNATAKTATYICRTTTKVKVGEVFGSALFELTGISPSGYAAGGTVTAVNYVSNVLKSITVSMPVNPGAASATVTTGVFMDWATPAKNQFTLAQYWKDNHVRPGQTAFYAFHEENGHEAEASIGTIAASILNIHDVLRRFVTHVKNIINPLQADPPIIHAQNNTPRFDHHDNRPRIGEASVSCCLMQDYLVLNALDTTYLTHPTFMMQSGNGLQLNSPHYDMKTEPMMGSVNGHSAVEYWNGTYTPPPILNDDWTMVLDQPTKILGTSSAAVEIDTVEVSDPNGFGGMQVFTLDLGTVGLLHRFSLEDEDFRNAETVEQTLSNLAIAGTGFTITGTFDIRRLYVAPGFKLSRTIIRPMVNANVIAASWDPVTQLGTVDFDPDGGTIDTAVGERMQVYQMAGEVLSSPWDSTTNPLAGAGGWKATTGTTAHRLVFSLTEDPGPWGGTSGRAARIAQWSVGRTFGNTHCFVKVEDPAAPKRWNIMTGEWLRERMLTPKPRAVFVRTKANFLVEQRTQIGALYADWLTFTDRIYDFADDRTWSAAGTAHDALGNTADDLTVRTNFTLTGTHNSGDNTCYAEANAANAWWAVGTASTLLRSAHKRGSRIRFAVSFRHKAGAQNQYVLATCAGEGTTQGPGIFLRINSGGQGLLNVRSDGATTAGVSFAASLTGITFATDTDYLVEIDIKDSDDGVTPGWGWIRVNGVIVFEDEVTFGNDRTISNAWVAPSTATSQSRLCLGLNGVTNGSNTPVGSSIRRLSSGYRYYFATTGSDTTLAGHSDTSDWTPGMNSWKWRQDGNAF